MQIVFSYHKLFQNLSMTWRWALPNQLKAYTPPIFCRAYALKKIYRQMMEILWMIIYSLETLL